MTDGPFVRAWVLPHEIDADRWTALRHDATRVLRAASARLERGRPDAGAGVLRGPDGLALPLVSEDRIAFNGSAFRGEAGDPFILERRSGTGVVVRAGANGAGRAVRRCDTHGHPYDLAVCALLLTVRRHLGDLMRLGTSGGLRDGWTEAAEVVREALGGAGQLVQSERGLISWAPVVTQQWEQRVRTSA